MHCICTPWAPRFSARKDTSRVCSKPTLFEGSSQPQVGDRHCVRIAECAHGNVGCCPGPNSWEHLQPSYRLLTINTVIQDQITLSNALRQCAECSNPILCDS